VTQPLIKQEEKPKPLVVKQPNIKPMTKKKMELQFENITIKTIPKVKKCCVPKDYKPDKEKTIIDGVSGAVLPGQFLAILGASGMNLKNV
jgi:ABC-type multidrug transport system fused ATPase/permease subunit